MPETQGVEDTLFVVYTAWGVSSMHCLIQRNHIFIYDFLFDKSVISKHLNSKGTLKELLFQVGIGNGANCICLAPAWITGTVFPTTSARIRHCFIILTGTPNPSASNLLEMLKKIFYTDVFIGIYLQRFNFSAEIILDSWGFLPIIYMTSSLVFSFYLHHFQIAGYLACSRGIPSQLQYKWVVVTHDCWLWTLKQ